MCVTETKQVEVHALVGQSGCRQQYSCRISGSWGRTQKKNKTTTKQCKLLLNSIFCSFSQFSHVVYCLKPQTAYQTLIPRCPRLHCLDRQSQPTDSGSRRSWLLCLCELLASDKWRRVADGLQTFLLLLVLLSPSLSARPLRIRPPDSGELSVKELQLGRCHCQHFITA